MKKSDVVFKCVNCGKLQLNPCMFGCSKCFFHVFVSLFKDDVREKALEIIGG